MRRAGVESIVQTEGRIEAPASFEVTPRMSDYVEHNCFALRWSDLSIITRQSLPGDELDDKACSEVVADLNQLKLVRSFDSQTTHAFSGLKGESSVLFESPKAKRRPYLEVLQAGKKA